MIPIPSPPWTGIGRRLESATRKALFDFQLVEGISRLGIALSGGKDSLTMLFLLNAIRGKGFPHIDIVGLHAGGETSCGASIGNPFLLDVCRQMNIPLVIREMPPFKGELECYSCSRRRRKLLFDMA
jgi:tRNA(Ile)-lysidine synthase TilS/MesJ